jgi:hypothetical protein
MKIAPSPSSSHSNPGGALATFPLRKGRRWAWLIAALVLLLTAGGIQAYGVYQAYQGWNRFGAAVVGGTIFKPLVVSGNLLLIGLVCATVAFVIWPKSILLFHNGFALKGRLGQRLWRWQDVAALRMSITRRDIMGIHIGIAHVYTVEDYAGKRLVLSDNFSDVEKLAQAIEENTFPILFERANQQFDLGRDVTFGPLVVNKTGIQIGRKNYLWDEIQPIIVRRGYLQIARKETGLLGRAKVALEKIPNLRVLLNIIGRVVEIKTKD